MITREQAKRCVGKGWHGLIDEFYDKYPEEWVNQVKEKYGRLCLYHNGSDESTDLELSIRERSSGMCEQCGARCTTTVLRGWMWTLCDLHAKEKEDGHKKTV